MKKAHQLAGLPSPTDDGRPRSVMGGIRRELGVRPAQKAPLMTDLVKQLVEKIPDDTQAGLRDRALLHPIAVFATSSGGDLADAIAASLPSADELDAMAIANLKRNVDLVQYAAAAERARQAKDFSLGSSVTDLAAPSSSGELSHSLFDPPAPRGETLWARLRRCREGIGDGEPVEDAVRHSLAGVGTRVRANGLGFDFKRIAEGDHGEKLVDPVVECLAFFGVAFFPVRGTGREREYARLRGWRDTERGTALAWATWSAALDRWAIDALLGQIFRPDASTCGIGITATFETVRYRPTGAMDSTRAFASRRVP